MFYFFWKCPRFYLIVFDGPRVTAISSLRLQDSLEAKSAGPTSQPHQRACMAKNKTAKKKASPVKQLQEETDKLAVQAEQAKKQMDKVQEVADTVVEKAGKAHRQRKKR